MTVENRTYAKPFNLLYYNELLMVIEPGPRIFAKTGKVYTLNWRYVRLIGTKCG
jgi:hypothetical protein